MSIKPIEVGCVAIIVRSQFPENVGAQVTVVAHDPSDTGGYVWEFEAAEPITCTVRGFLARREKVKRAWCLNADLLRIDGHDPDLLKEWDDLEVISKMKGLHHA